MFNNTASNFSKHPWSRPKRGGAGHPTPGAEMGSAGTVIRLSKNKTDCLMSNVYYCETVSEQRAARCIVAPGGPGQRRWEAHPGIPPPAPRVEKHETPERD
jgi:hypothetical protein